MILKVPSGAYMLSDMIRYENKAEKVVWGNLWLLLSLWSLLPECTDVILDNKVSSSGGCVACSYNINQVIKQTVFISE